MVRALSLLAIALVSSCSVDLGIEGMRYRCRNDSECSPGFACDPVLMICAMPGEGDVDAGERACGFDESFDNPSADDWHQDGNSLTPPSGAVELTAASTNQRGTLWYRRPIRADRFTYEMEFSIFGGGDRGGDGMSMAWVQEDDTARGGTTANLGVYGLHGYVVEIDTFPNAGIGDPPTEHIAFARTRGELLPDVDQFGNVAALPSLRSQDHRLLRIEFDAPVAAIYLDGSLVLTATAASYQPFDATFGATAATGAAFDSQQVHRLTLVCR